MPLMTRLVVAAVFVASSAPATVVLNNERVRAYRTTANALDGVSKGPGVVIWLKDGVGGTAGRAIWLDDVARVSSEATGSEEIVIVQPVPSAAEGPVPSAAEGPGARAAPQMVTPQTGSKPGAAPFTGMSFVPLFENQRVSVIRARMDVDAREGEHTHGSDTIVVHLSGGEIEDTANGTTVVNRWKPGDAEFEPRGSSHSARNMGQPVDVVLVVLKP
jgi:quercetin dioxygenase-like cupin family protein